MASFARLFFLLVLLAAGLGLLLGGASASLRLDVLPELDIEPDYSVHWHARVTLQDASGMPVRIPADVGLYPDGPHSPVHTHDDSGLLHVEADRLEDLPPHTLAYFFSVWQEPLNAACVLDLCTDSASQLRFYVNGVERLDWRTYDLADGDEVQFVLERDVSSLRA